MIPVSQPWITSLEKKYVNEALDSGWISSAGKFIDKFEAAFAEYVGVKYAIATNNGTSACHLALQSCGLGVGDTVLVPAVTFIATANAAKYCGCSVKLADINKDSWNIELTKRPHANAIPRAVFGVHLYGNMCDYGAIGSWLHQTNTLFIEDACEALGGTWGTMMAGTMGKTAAFSFYGNKTISTGEGGMMVTNDASCAERARRLRGQGQTQRYHHVEVGYNYRMTNIQAALGLAQIERIDEIMAEKIRVYDRYTQNLRHESIRFAKQGANTVHSKWAVTIRVPDRTSRDNVTQALAHEGIETRPVFEPLPLLPPYRENPADYPNAIALWNQGITLPSYPELTNREIDMICEVVRRET